jgi:NhaP-type Na+/H+ or K+/H+ antiporter
VLEGQNESAALTVAFALAAGMVAQAIAHHLRVPGIVLLLAAGVVLGPDVAGVVLPPTLGPGLQALVGIAVAVVLFEGGLSLDMRRIRREQKAIRRLVTLGALISLVLGTVIASIVLGLDLSLALLFGTLIIVTGPTVITPLVRRWRLRSDVATCSGRPTRASRSRFPRSRGGSGSVRSWGS